jgi:purine-binding chemotaxis protein CheW
MSTVSHLTGHRARAQASPIELLVFRLGGVDYGVDTQKVRELLGYDGVMRLDDVPLFIKGVVELRGAIVPIVDPRLKFGLGAPVYDAATTVVVLCLAGRLIGMVADGATDVVTLRPDQIKPAASPSDYLIGLGMREAGVLRLVDPYRLMAGPEIGLYDQLAA